jgi:hypothetical protein
MERRHRRPQRFQKSFSPKKEITSKRMEDGGKKCVYITKMTTQTKRSRHTQEPGAAFASIQKNIETPHLVPTQKKEKPVGGKTSRRRERDTQQRNRLNGF